MARCKTDKEIAREGNELARLFYQHMGYEVPKGYRFDLAHHPQEIAMWNMAVMAYEHINGTDLQSAADNEE
jgi:hypothetical protein